MVSIRSSDYAAIGGGGNGIGGRGQLSRWLARGPPPGGKEEEDNDSTPVAFDVDDSNGSKVEVNGDWEGDGNSNGPIDNNDGNECNVDNNNNDDNGGGQDRSANVGQLGRSGKRWR
jgi:hypothetical protein